MGYGHVVHILMAINLTALGRSVDRSARVAEGALARTDFRQSKSTQELDVDDDPGIPDEDKPDFGEQKRSQGCCRWQKYQRWRHCYWRCSWRDA